jgi:hypothetical protein
VAENRKCDIRVKLSSYDIGMTYSDPNRGNFELDGTKRTWEEEIALHPILKPGSGPVLGWLI